MSELRTFLSDSIESQLAQGVSYRALARKCGLGSPNYLQTYLRTPEAKMSIRTATRLADGLGFDESDKHHLLKLVRKELGEDIDVSPAKQDSFITKQVITNHISKEWFFPLVIELCKSLSTGLTLDDIQKKMRSRASRESIVRALKEMTARGWIKKKDDKFFGSDTLYMGTNDLREFDLRKSHEHYLNLAKHALSDNLNDREFQALTMAIAPEDLKLIKDMQRRFVKETADLLTKAERERKIKGVDTPKRVVRLQTASYFISNK